MTQVDELKTEKREGSSESAKVVFTPEQQARVQELIDDAYRRAYAKATRSRVPAEEVERLRSELDALREERKMAAILRAVSRHNVVDAGEVAELIKGRVKIDETGNITVLADSGSSLINSEGGAMGLEEYVDRWLSERPHHLRNNAGAGSGSGKAMFGPEGSTRYDLSDPATWRSMPREDLDRLLKEGVKIQGSSGQVYSFRSVKNPFVEARKRKFSAAG